jgi:hypothetical protein
MKLTGSVKKASKSAILMIIVDPRTMRRIPPTLINHSIKIMHQKYHYKTHQKDEIKEE